MISRVSHLKVQYARGLTQRKNRAAYQQFIVEGIRVIEEAERAGQNPALVFFVPSQVENDARAAALLKRLQARTDECHAVSERVLGALSDTPHPQGIVAVYPFPALAIPPSPNMLLVLDALRDPGNLGSILRTAWAAGVDGVILTPTTADPFNPKEVRAAMGAHFSIPIEARGWAEIEPQLARIPRVYLADARGERDYTQVSWIRPFALILSGEAGSARDDASRVATERVRIPMPRHAESLNVAVAAGILLFAATRVA